MRALALAAIVVSTGQAFADDDGLRIQGLGQVDATAVDAVLAPRTPDVQKCFSEGLGRFRYLAGTLELRVRVTREGAVKTVAASQPIGDLAVERCAAAVVRAQKFPAPSGGLEAEFDYRWQLAAQAPLQNWSTADVGAVVGKHRNELRPCERLGNVPPSVRVTFYVMPGGKVSSVGVGAASSKLDEKYAQCVADKITTWRFADPLGKVARATYQF